MLGLFRWPTYFTPLGRSRGWIRPISTRRLSSILLIFSSAKKLRSAVLPMIAMSTLAKPLVSTLSAQSSKLSVILAALLPHWAVPVRVSVLVKPKSIISFTPSPTMGICPVTMACTAIHSSRRVVASFRRLYSSINCCALRCAGVMPLYRSSPGIRVM